LNNKTTSYGSTVTRRPVQVSLIGCTVSLPGLSGSSPGSKKRSVNWPATLAQLNVISTAAVIRSGCSTYKQGPIREPGYN